MTDNNSTLVSEVSGVIILTPLLQEALRLGGMIDWEEYLRPAGAEAPASFKFNVFIVNEDKANIPHLHGVTPDKLGWAVMTAEESKQAEKFLDYKAGLEDKRVLICNLADNALAKVIKPSDASRYFTEGRRRIKGKIYKRLGRWFNCPGYLLSLTFDPGKISRPDAWKQVGALRREFMNRVNRWRKRHGYSKAKCIPVLEVQPATGYPHIHIVFPYLKYLAPVVWMREQWGQAENSVNFQVKDSVSPVSYVCKYISKLEGWSDMALSYIWVNRTRLYSMSRDYILPDYSDKRVPEWHFSIITTIDKLNKNMPTYRLKYHTILDGGGEKI
ncbi:hypothetical protein ACFLXD_05365 [Chloroflexota bacterium]